MKKLGIIVLLLIGCFAFLNVKAYEAISVPTCSVSLTSNTDKEYEVTIKKVTENAPMPSEEKITLKNGEEKNFGSISYDDVGEYEYEISLSEEDKVYIFTVVITNDGGSLVREAFVKEKGQTEKIDSITYVKNEDITPDPKPDDDTPTPTPSNNTKPARPVNPYTADFIIKFLIALIASGAVVFIVVKLMNKEKEVK